MNKTLYNNKPVKKVASIWDLSGMVAMLDYRYTLFNLQPIPL